MIEELKPYDSYKSPGLRWAERIPAHWEVDRARSCLHKLNLRSREGREELLTVSSARGVVPRKSATVTMFKAKSYAGYKLCWPDDLVINSLWAWAGGLGVSRNHGIVSSAYGVYRSRPSSKLLPGYLHELVRSAPFNWELQVRSKGIWISRLQLSDDAFLAAPVLVPPPEEQAAIVRFLDHANRRIDEFTRAKKKLIALLNEQKQAIVHRAVTRGLDPDVKLKDSGVPWLGAIPDHWDVRRFKMIATINSGQVDPRKSQHRSMVLVAPNHIEKATGRLLKTETAQEQGAISGKYLVRRGQVIYSKIRPALQKATLAPFDCLCSADMYAIDARSSIITPAFLLLLLLSRPFSQYTVDASLRVAMPKVNQDALAVCPLWLPPRQEQDAIVALVQESSAPLDRAIARAEREIALMREYRTRLVADVVTGELDARAAAASLPAVELGIALTESEGDETDIDDGEAA